MPGTEERQKQSDSNHPSERGLYSGIHLQSYQIGTETFNIYQVPRKIFLKSALLKA